MFPEDSVVQLKPIVQDITRFTEMLYGIKLRSYQVEVALAVIRSIFKQQGLSIVVIFPRQSGKNELQAHLEAFLLTWFSNLDGELVKVSPTWKPQSQNAMRRLEHVLKRNLATGDFWKKKPATFTRSAGDGLCFSPPRRAPAWWAPPPTCCWSATRPKT